MDTHLYTSPSLAPVRIWTDTSSLGDGSTLQVLRRPGGFWLAYRAEPTTAIELRELDELGRPGSRKVSLERTLGLGSYVIASDGRWLVVSIEGTETMEVQLYDAANASFVSALAFGGERPDCGRLAATGAAVYDDGAIRVAVSRTTVSWQRSAAGVCAYLPDASAMALGEHELFFMSATPAGEWTPPVRAVLALPATFTFLPVPLHVLNVPCQAGWLAVYSSPPDAIVRRYAPDGTEVSRDDGAAAGLHAVTGALVTFERCESHTAQLILVSTDRDPGRRERIRRMQMNTQTGALVRFGADEDFGADVSWVGSMASASGRAFMAALDNRDKPRLLEFGPTGPLRTIEFTPLGRPRPDASPAELELAAALHGVGRSVSVGAGQHGTVLAFGPGRMMLTDLGSYLEPGATGAPVALTYRFACPP